jgi:uncharacterized membrane protein YesL
MKLTDEDWDSEEADIIGGYFLIGVIGLCPVLLGLLIIIELRLLPLIPTATITVIIALFALICLIIRDKAFLYPGAVLHHYRNQNDKKKEDKL